MYVHMPTHKKLDWQFIRWSEVVGANLFYKVE